MPVPKVENVDNFAPSAPPAPAKSQSENFVSATVDTTMVRFDQLTQYIAGASWSVDYFSRVIGRDDDPRPYELTSHAVYQQYKQIMGMELKVTSPLTPSQNAETKDMSLRGNATVYGVLIPKENDCFLADIGDGREGIFTVISTNRMTHRMSTVHEIEYALIGYSTKEIREDLARKTVEKVVFHKDFLETGDNPMLTVETTQLINNMREHYSRLISLYFHDFFSRDYRTLLVPNQKEVTYDPFLVKYIKTILNSEDHPYIRQMTEYNVVGDQAMYEFTLWNCLSEMDFDMLGMCVYNAGLVSSKQFFNGSPTLNSIYYSGIQRVVYPDMAATHVDAGYHNPINPDLTNIVRGSARFNELDRLMSNQLSMDPTMEIYEAADPNNVSQIHRVTYDDYYVLSESFYRHDQTKRLTKLEALTMAALKGDPIDLLVLDELCTGSRKWDNVERFFYTPILLTLLKVYRRRM